MRALACCVLFAACDSGRTSEPTPTRRPPPPIADARRVVIDAAILDAAPPDRDFDDGDPIKAALIDAFGGHLPQLPALAPDGTHAAIDLSQWEGMSSTHDYKIGLIDTRGVIGEKWVVMNLRLAETFWQDQPPPVPKQQLATAAAKVTKHLEGFTPFAAPIDLATIEGANGEVAIGATMLKADRQEGKRLALRWVDAHGAVLRSETLAAIPREVLPDREGGRCGGTPRVAAVWWRETPRRLLIEIVYPGSDSCSDEPVQWRLW